MYRGISSWGSQVNFQGPVVVCWAFKPYTQTYILHDGSLGWTSHRIPKTPSKTQTHTHNVHIHVPGTFGCIIIIIIIISSSSSSNLLLPEKKPLMFFYFKKPTLKMPQNKAVGEHGENDGEPVRCPHRILVPVIYLICFHPRHPVIPPDVWCFRYVFGVQIPNLRRCLDV